MQDATNYLRAADSIFLHKSQPRGRVDFARPVAGCMIGEAHYSLRKLGYWYGAAEVVTEVQLVRDGEIIERSSLTIGDDSAMVAKAGLAWEVQTEIKCRIRDRCAAERDYLLRVLETVVKPEVR